ncbi:Zinc finger protein ZIC 3 [Talaromyces pinophilus]|nr:Zinc finger protein ZIC 3 [Talaromyces pinophilus]
MAPGGSRGFNCSWERCGKSFNRKSDLCRHYRIHTNERPYHCTVPSCNKSFIQRSALTVHSRTHTGEKPHVCDHEDCRKAFSDSSSLARHRRIHTGRRPYICSEPACDRSFCRKTTLTKHQSRTHQPGGDTRPSSEEAPTPESMTYQTPVITTMTPNSNQYIIAQQPYYHNGPPPPTTADFYQTPQPAMHFTQPQAMVPQPIPTAGLPTPPFEPQHYAQIMQQQQQQPRYDPTPHPTYIQPQYQSPTPPFVAQQQHHMTADVRPLMATYHPDQFKPPARILSSQEGTDWSFLGCLDWRCSPGPGTQDYAKTFSGDEKRPLLGLS